MNEDLTGPVDKTKKKKEKAPPPPCPPAIATAYLILRGAVGAITGAAVVVDSTKPDTVVHGMSTSPMVASLLQATYLKEDGTGKFGVGLGKKLGDLCELDLPDQTDNEHESVQALYTAIETVANRIIAENCVIQAYSMTKACMVEKFGECCLDSSYQKTSNDVELTVAVVKDFIVAVPPAIPLARTGYPLTAIKLDRSQCSLLCGKKARKADLTLKFVVVLEPHDKVGNPFELASVTRTINDVDTTILQQARIRCPEGTALKEKYLAACLDATKIEETTIDLDDALDEEMVVNVEEVKGKIDYMKLVEKFGSTLINESLKEKLERETVGKGRVDQLHRFLRRGMFFSHRDLHTLLDAVSNQTPLYLYTGRGPSSASMHLGHLIPFLFTKWLQDAFDAPLVIQMTDDEKFLFKGTYDEIEGDNLNDFKQLTMENAKDIIACGFDYNKTFIFSDLDYVGSMYPNIVRIWKAVTSNAVSNIFGFDGSSNIGKIAFPAVQAAPSFASSFPRVLQADRNSNYLCLIPCAIDQDPYFRMTRDIAHKLCHKQHRLGGKPALIHSKFFPPLQGATGKMSSSDTNSAIFLTDTPEVIERKIKEHAFSGGRDTKKLQQELGADLDIDVSFQWLRFFLEDDCELEEISISYGSGQGKYWSTASVKAKLVEVLQKLVREHQERRAQISDEEVLCWMQERNIVVDR